MTTENIGKCNICGKRRQLLGKVGSGLNQYCKQCVKNFQKGVR